MTSPTRDLLSSQDLLSLQQRPSGSHGPLLVDIRRPGPFRRAHIPGSHNIPAGLLMSSEPPEGDLILIGDNDSDSRAAAEALHNSGYHRRIQRLAGGFSHWQSEGLPQENGLAIATSPSDRLPWIPVLALGAVLLGIQHLSVPLVVTGLAVVLSPFTVAALTQRLGRHLLRRSA